MKTLFHTSQKSWFLLVLIVIVGTLAIQGWASHFPCASDSGPSDSHGPQAYT